jgi:hypothetical protein
MCDPVLIAAILEELGYFDEKKGNDKKRDISDKKGNKDSLQDSREEEQKEK